MENNLLQQAHEKLFPGRSSGIQFLLRYTDQFSDYNANIRKIIRGFIVTYDAHISRKWSGVDDEIVIGLLQSLLLRVEKAKREKTLEMQLYDKFLKNVHWSVKKSDQDIFLLGVFHRVNDRYFNGLLDETNLIWAENNMRTLGTYKFATDTISISSVFRPCVGTKDEIFIDRIMHHEMLHKKLKFDSSKSKSRYHTTEFRKRENEFEDFENVEKRITDFLRRKKIRSWFS